MYRNPLPAHTSVIHIATVSSACSTMNKIISSHYFPCCFKTALGKIKPLKGAWPIKRPCWPSFLNLGAGGWRVRGRRRGAGGGRCGDGGWLRAREQSRSCDGLLLLRVCLCECVCVCVCVCLYKCLCDCLGVCLFMSV